MKSCKFVDIFATSVNVCVFFISHSEFFFFFFLTQLNNFVDYICVEYRKREWGRSLQNPPKKNNSYRHKLDSHILLCHFLFLFLLRSNFIIRANFVDTRLLCSFIQIRFTFVSEVSQSVIVHILFFFVTIKFVSRFVINHSNRSLKISTNQMCIIFLIYYF